MNRETKCGVLCSETPICRIWVDLCSKVIKITCWVRQDQIWPKQNFMSSHSISAPVIYKNERRRKTGHCSTHKANLLNLVKNKTRSQEELLRKDKALRDAQIRSKHEMGKKKRAQKQQVDEFSMQNLREDHETFQQLTFQLQQMQEQMNSMNSSGEFQVIEWNYSGRLCHVWS